MFRYWSYTIAQLSSFLQYCTNYPDLQLIIRQMIANKEAGWQVFKISEQNVQLVIQLIENPQNLGTTTFANSEVTTTTLSPTMMTSPTTITSTTTMTSPTTMTSSSSVPSSTTEPSLMQTTGSTESIMMEQSCFFTQQQIDQMKGNFYFMVDYRRIMWWFQNKREGGGEDQCYQNYYLSNG